MIMQFDQERGRAMRESNTQSLMDRAWAEPKWGGGGAGGSYQETRVSDTILSSRGEQDNGTSQWRRRNHRGGLHIKGDFTQQQSEESPG